MFKQCLVLLKSLLWVYDEGRRKAKSTELFISTVRDDNNSPMKPIVIYLNNQLDM